MICTAANRPTLIQADIAVVGAGPSGLALALSLARSGLEVLVVESGLDGRDPRAQALSSASSQAPQSHAPMDLATERRLGGASWIWGGRCVDFDPADFEAKPTWEVPGWPISHAEATSEAAAAAAFMGVGEPRFDEAATWTTLGGPVTTRVERWCAEPRLARYHRPDILSNPKAKFHLGLTCTAVALEPDGGRVACLRVKDQAGTEHEVRARHYVLAAGGIGVARLLLASNDVAAQGVGGHSGWLGRGYMGHLKGDIADLALTGLSEAQVGYRRDEGCYVRPRITLAAATLREEGLANIAFQPDNPPFADWRHRSGPLSAVALALSTPGLGKALLDGPIRPLLLGVELRRQDIGPHLRNVALDLPAVAGFVAGFVPRRYGRPRLPGAFLSNPGRRYLLKYSAEHTPIRDSRVVLTDDRDAMGVRRVSIHQEIPQQDVESVLRAHQILDADLRRGGLGRLEFHGEPAQMLDSIRRTAADGYHQIGLARMSATPAHGVVDTDCRVHGIANLHLAGTAVLPTSGQANPTYLAVCLALRLARHLAGRRAI
jgi:choline dehydrogenase-like flavoprotein